MMERTTKQQQQQLSLQAALLHQLTEVLAAVAALAEVLCAGKGDHRLLAAPAFSIAIDRSLSSGAGLRPPGGHRPGAAVAADDVHATNVLANDHSNVADEGVPVLVCTVGGGGGVGVEIEIEKGVRNKM